MNNTELTALIQRVKELDEKATQGPWSYTCNFRCHGALKGGHLQSSHHDLADIKSHSVGSQEQCDVNGECMEEYRTAAPQLAAECERLREELAEAKVKFKEWIESHNLTVRNNVARENALRAELAEARKGNP